ncbi:hypothetical protein BCR42DRAFT_394830 [Absidia repens]|uniref:Uncharacterized protein n=1 Tax=Absidia repens TaxID=90262 RepID=A0A1X2I9X7_9FUNG|nr:hypothetical protein BCR42DRAFT_394830 [Absidia repens]
MSESGTKTGLDQESPNDVENLPPAEKRWFVNDQDISRKFHEYRQSCILVSCTTEFFIETHFNELLAMSGVLVSQRRSGYVDLPTDIFSFSLLTAARTETLAKYRRDTFKPHVSSALQSIIQQFVDEKHHRNMCIKIKTRFVPEEIRG